MSATVTFNSGAYVPNIQFDDPSEIATVLTATRFRYSWETSDGDIVTLTGSFTYSSGALNSFGTVSRVRVDFATNGTGWDLQADFSVKTGKIAGLTSESSSTFWGEVLKDDDTITISEDGIFFSSLSSFRSGFGADGRVSVGSVAAGDDTITIEAEGMFSGDTLRVAGSHSGGTDSITVNRSDSGKDVFVVGDFLNASLTSTQTATGGDDTIIDTTVSTAATDGLTYLVGDVGDAASSISIIGGDDTITGGEVAAIIVGDLYKFSDDIILSLTGGTDVLTGGSSGDLIAGEVYDADFETSVVNTVTGGDDLIYGGEGADTLYGEYALGDFVSVSGGNDSLYGGAAGDEIYGQTGADYIEGGGGADYVKGGNGGDTIYGKNGADEILGGDGKDTIRGEKGNDSINGNAQDDSIAGGQGQDVLRGQSGDDILKGGRNGDTLYGGSGDDTLTGDQAADVFVFSTRYDDDVITDFDVAKAGEVIDLSGNMAITDYTDLETNHISQVGSDVVIDDLSGSTLTVLGITLADLDASHFTF